jgi:hypothetical protein
MEQLVVECPCGCSAYHDEQGPVQWYIQRCEHHDSADALLAERDELVAQRDALVGACEALYDGIKSLGCGGALPVSMRKARAALALVRGEDGDG